LKAKQCKQEGCNNPAWSKGMCQWHKPKKPLQQNVAPLNRKPIKPISDKRKKQQTAYKVLREAYLKEHGVCEICGTPNPTDIHHKGGRMEDKLNDFTNVMALCRPCHHEIHHVSPKWARENGYLN
jgi:hypothetical protein